MLSFPSLQVCRSRKNVSFSHKSLFESIKEFFQFLILCGPHAVYSQILSTFLSNYTPISKACNHLFFCFPGTKDHPGLICKLFLLPQCYSCVLSSLTKCKQSFKISRYCIPLFRGLVTYSEELLKFFPNVLEELTCFWIPFHLLSTQWGQGWS